MGDYFVDGPIFLKSGVSFSGTWSDDTPNYTTFQLYQGENNGKTSEDAMFVVDKGGGFEGAGRRLAQRRLKSSMLEGKTLPLRSACLSRIFEAWCAWGLCPSNVSILLKHASGSTGMSQAPKLLLRLTQMRIRQIISVLSGILREGTRSRNSSSKQGFLSRTRPCLTVRPVTDP